MGTDNVANTALLEGDYEESLSLFTEGLDARLRRPTDHGVCWNLRGISKSCMNLGKLKAARKVATEALQKGYECNDPELVASRLLLIAIEKAFNSGEGSLDEPTQYCQFTGCVKQGFRACACGYAIFCPTH